MGNFLQKVNMESYERGDAIYKLNDNFKPGVSRKLQSKWLGPFIVIGVSKDRALVQEEDTRGRKTLLHHDKLKHSLTPPPLSLQRRRKSLFTESETEQPDTPVTNPIQHGDLVNFSDEDLHLQSLGFDTDVGTPPANTRVAAKTMRGRKTTTPLKYSQ